MFFKLFRCSSIRKTYSTFSRNSISEIYKLVDKKLNTNISAQGWVQNKRVFKDKIFIVIKDGSSIDRLQLVVPKDIHNAKLIHNGASVEVTGVLSQNKRNQLELHVSSVNVLGGSKITEGYPFNTKQDYKNTDYTRQYLHFRSRLDHFQSIYRLRDLAYQSIHNYFISREFISINTPILTSNDCEGAGEVFTVQPDNKVLLRQMTKDPSFSSENIFFDKKVFLTVSGQMHLEAAAHAFSKVYTLGPTFRAENSKSRLHLSEFYMLEAELAFLDNLDGLIVHVEQMLKLVTERIIDKNLEDLTALLSYDVEKHFEWLNKKFVVMSYEDAIDVLKKHDQRVGEGLTKENEHFLVEYNGSTPTFVINWPKNLKPFYMKSLEQDDTKVSAFDLLVPNVGELAGGSLRENSYTKLEAQIPKIDGAVSDNFKWYLELRKFGSVPTGGYGMGFERYIQFIFNIPNIKDTLPFPRWPHNCSM